MKEKDFDGWNKVKKEVNTHELRRDFFYHQREVWWCALGANVGVEADGKHGTFERPVLVLRVFNKEMLWIVPITSTIKTSPFYYRFLFKGDEQSVNLGQIKVISSKRLKRRIDFMSENDFENIVTKLIGFLRKNETPPEGGESRRPKPLIQ